MKKVFLCMIVILMPLMMTQTGFAASEFSLINGDLAEKSTEYALLQEFFQSIQISSSFDAAQNKYSLSGNASITGSYEYVINDATGTDSCTGEIFGEFDPQSGEYKGQFSYEQTFDGKFNDGNGTFSGTGYVLYGEFSGISNPGETSVNLTFKGTKMVVTLEGSVTESPIVLNVLFSISGALPMTEPEETEEPEVTEEPEETEETEAAPSKSVVPDSGARFSDLNGQVEVLIPKGYDTNGEPNWDEEAWTFAKLDMPLPEGTRIKTSDRSSVILSFADMTTFVMEPESEIVLSKPEAGAGPLRLVIGSIWTNFKKMMKDGSMEIEMGQAVTGIKGTTLVLEEDGETSTLKVIEGTVELTSKATGDSVTVEGGEMINATEDGLGDIEEFDVEEEMESWEQYGAVIPQEGFPLWALLAIGGVVILAVVIVTVAVSSRRKKRLAAMARPFAPAQSAPPPPAPGFFCAQCGAPLESGAAFCAKCGSKTGI